MAETTPTAPQEYTPFIHADAQTLRDIYHMAHSGVEVEYAGLTGRTLALQAAIDLYQQGDRQAYEWMVGIHEARYQESLLPENESSIGAAVAGFLAVNELYALEAGVTVEDVEVAVRHAVDTEVFESEMIGIPAEQATRHELIYKVDLLESVASLRNFGIEDTDEDILRGIAGLMASLNKGIEKAGQPAKVYRSLKGIHEQIAPLLTDNEMHAFEQAALPTLERIARGFTKTFNTDQRNAAANATVDLHVYDPENKAYKKLLKQRQRDIMARSMSRKYDDATDYLDLETRERVMAGTVFDISTMAWLTRIAIAAR